MKYLLRIYHQFMMDRYQKRVDRYENHFNNRSYLHEGANLYRECLKAEHRYHHYKVLKTMNLEKMDKRIQKLTSL